MNPFIEWNVRTPEDGVRAYREIPFAQVAAVETILAGGNALAAVALGTNRAVRPQAGFEVFPSGFYVGDKVEKFFGTDCQAVVHGLNSLVDSDIIPEMIGGVNWIIPETKGSRFSSFGGGAMDAALSSVKILLRKNPFTEAIGAASGVFETSTVYLV